MGILRRFLERVTESDEHRLLDEIREWAESVPNVTPIGEAEFRHRVRVAGIVRRITVWPREGGEPEYLEAMITDGTGQIGATWIGRRSIPGLSLGTRLIIEGVLRDDRGTPSMDNPKFEFAL
jgi:hypothetical protein